MGDEEIGLESETLESVEILGDHASEISWRTEQNTEGLELHCSLDIPKGVLGPFRGEVVMYLASAEKVIRLPYFGDARIGVPR
jgi:hypothetical protein